MNKPTYPKQAYARYTLEATTLLGKMIRHGRKQRRMSIQELAERMGVSRATLQSVEKGDPKVKTGTVFEAAAMVGVKLFDADDSGLSSLSERWDDRLALLPKRIRKTERKDVNDF